MTERAFQAELVALVLDPDRRDAVATGAASCPPELTEQEWARIAEAARSRGMDACRAVHKAFRLNKLLTLLPHVCAVLGPDLLAAEVAGFWRERPPRGFHYADEAADFCDRLARRASTAALSDDPQLLEAVTLAVAVDRPSYAGTRAAGAGH